MKKIITILIICLAIVFCSSCQDFATVEKVEKETLNESMFIVIEDAYNWRVVYHKETKVMYVISYGKFNYGNFTLLVDENGKPLLWQEK